MSFKKGDKIEVRRPNHSAVWFPATFLHSSSNRVYVKFETSTNADDPTSPLERAYFSANDVRPAQPPELHRYLKVGEMVEGFCRERKGWVQATVVDILENSKYTVSFEGEGSVTESVLEQWELRAFREWINGFWNPPFPHQQATQSQVKSSRPTLKIKCNEKRPEMIFREDMLVEVTSDMDGFLGSWFPAVILKALQHNKFLVEYRTLRTDDMTEYLKEEADVSCMRYCPPTIQRVKPYACLERVDAWYNDGWWEGCITQVLKGCSYMVTFHLSNEKMIFEHVKLRPHQEWIDGKWFSGFQASPTDLTPKSTNLKRKHGDEVSGSTFKDGMVVEVKSDEEGYQGSWYTAVVVCSLSSDKFLVEYQTLRVDDESKLLCEEAFASDIRPCPPVIEWFGGYKILEKVDAWYNEGWWVGLISGAVDDQKYVVYFWTTNEELILEHSSLRPHQDWIGGKWIVSSRKQSRLRMKSKLGKYKKGCDGKGVESSFMIGMKVEVKSEEPNYRGCWYPGVIVKALAKAKYMIEYQTVMKDDGSQLHKGAAHSVCIRPCPPIVQRKDPFKAMEKVDAWHNNGWWVGWICEAFPGRKYSVCLESMKVPLEFQHSDLRPHQEWINWHWVKGSQSPAE